MITKQLTTRGLARKAYFLIKSKRNWCQEHYAEDEEGKVVFYDDDLAYKFCADGALQSILYKTKSNFSVYYMVEQIIRKIYKKSTIRINDTDGHEAVLTALKKIGWGKW